MNHTNEAWEEEQMSNLGCESVSDLIAEVKRLRDELDNERVAKPYSVSNERLWEQIDRCNRIASESVTRALDIEVKEIVDIDGGHKKYPFEKDSETGRFDMENYEWVNPSERLWLDAVVAEVKRLREAFAIAVRHVGYHHSQDDLWYALRERGMDDLYDDDEEYGEWKND